MVMLKKFGPMGLHRGWDYANPEMHPRCFGPDFKAALVSHA